MNLAFLPFLIPSPASIRVHPRSSAVSFRTLLLALLATLLSGCGTATPPATQADTLRLTINQRVFSLEIAAAPEKRFQGLSDRQSIAEDGGMIFIFPQASELAFVMRRCAVPIDLIFVDPSGRVVNTHQMKVEADPEASDAKLTKYTSAWPAQFAIELKGGTLPGLKLEPGQRLDLPVEELKRLAR